MAGPRAVGFEPDDRVVMAQFGFDRKLHEQAKHGPSDVGHSRLGGADLLYDLSISVGFEPDDRVVMAQFGFDRKLHEQAKHGPSDVGHSRLGGADLLYDLS